jgi:GNAT superfamily N-acetyltransferase
LSKEFCVVPGTRASLSTLAGVLRRGFQNEPVQEWLFPNRYCRALASELWFRGLIKSALQRSTVWRLEDNSSAAVWFQPGVYGKGIGLADTALSALIAFNRRTKWRKTRLDHEIEVRRPREPHWYLAAVATEAVHRSQGRGRVVLSPALEACDRERILAYLETATPQSVKFYESLGFEVSSSFSLPDGPQVWCMGRSPRRREVKDLLSEERTASSRARNRFHLKK